MNTACDFLRNFLNGKAGKGVEVRVLQSHLNMSCSKGNQDWYLRCNMVEGPEYGGLKNIVEQGLNIEGFVLVVGCCCKTNLDLQCHY